MMAYHDLTELSLVDKASRPIRLILINTLSDHDSLTQHNRLMLIDELPKITDVNYNFTGQYARAIDLVSSWCIVRYKAWPE